MCGIGGILRTDGQPIPEEWLDAIDARIAYRGPDGHGRFRDRVEIADVNAPGGKRVVEVAFVHRRLSIIDHKDGAQPMVSERGRNDSEGLVAVVFNGCIYNHRELRKELEAKGHRFVTDHSDTEVLIHGWREWGEEITDRLEGMYALAVWERLTATVFFARDRFGEKPLYVEQRNDIVRFASSSWTDVGTLSSRSTQRYLQTGYLGFSIDEQVGCGFGLRVSGAAEFRFANPQPLIWGDKRSKQEDIERLLDRAVSSRLEADVPLACFLSGGIDSSLVALFAKRHKPDLQTLCVRMPDGRYDESAHASDIAAHLGTRHETLEVSASPADDLVRLIVTLRQPFGDSSILPTHWVARAARQHAKVALSGDGGDELFIGYQRYLGARHLARHWPVLRMLPIRPLVGAHPKATRHKLARLIQAARDYEDVGLMGLESLFSLEDQRGLMKFDADDVVWLDVNHDDPLQSLRMGDVREYLPNDLLRKVDTASMACGLEVRCPFLDRDLARAALAAPIAQLMPGGQRKGLLRQIARRYLPKEIVDRPKMGFAIPIGEWFRSDYGGMKTLLLDHLNSAEPFGPIQLNRKAVQRFIDEHMSEKRDHGQRLFTLLTLSIWARQVAR